MQKVPLLPYFPCPPGFSLSWCVAPCATPGAGGLSSPLPAQASPTSFTPLTPIRGIVSWPTCSSTKSAHELLFGLSSVLQNLGTSNMPEVASTLAEMNAGIRHQSLPVAHHSLARAVCHVSLKVLNSILYVLLRGIGPNILFIIIEICTRYMFCLQ